MTCIVGLVHDGKVWMGGDRAAVSERHYLMITDQPKVFHKGEKGEMVIGYTSSFRMGQLLQYKLHLPELKVDQPIDEYMAVDFSDAVRQLLKDNGYVKVDNNREESGIFLVGFRSLLYYFDDDLAVHRHGLFNACGCGVSVAQGSLYTSAITVPEAGPESRIRWALEAANRFTTGVRPPFDIICEGVTGENGVA
jgi:hypothetical protein